MSNRTRTATPVVTLVAVAALAAASASCSASPSTEATTSSLAAPGPAASAPDTTTGSTPAGSGSSGSSSDPDPAASGGDCTVNGEVRGDDTARYIERPATVSLTNAGAGAPPAFYSSEQNTMALFLYAEGAAPANVIWTVTGPSGSETTYTSSPSSTGLAIEADGSGARVTTTLESADRKTVEMDITVAC